MMRLLQHRALLTLILLLFVFAVLIGSRDLGRVARFVPLVVAIPTFLLIGLQLLFDLAPGCRDRLGNLRRTAWARPSPPTRADSRDAAGFRSEAPPHDPAGRRPPARRLVWTFLLPLLIYLLGFLIALPLYVFVQLRLLGGERWRLALAIPVLLCLLLLLCGRFLPAIPLWQGRLWTLLGLGIG